MRFLQTQVAAVVNHTNAKESEEFRSLSGWLLTSSPTGASDKARNAAPSVVALDDEEIRTTRLSLFNELILMLPADMRPPSKSISDLI
jgi:hypothetical protein